MFSGGWSREDWVEMRGVEWRGGIGRERGRGGGLFGTLKWSPGEPPSQKDIYSMQLDCWTVEYKLFYTG